MPYYDFQGLKLYWESEGSGSRALLFIHGLMGQGRIWKHQCAHFRDNYEVITVDLFGHGRSSKDVDPVWAPRLDAEAIVGLMESIVGKPYVAVGHSFASNILPEILRLSLSSSFLKGIVFVDCTYQGLKSVVEGRVKFADRMLSLPHESLVFETEDWYTALIGEEVSQEDRELILEPFRQSDLRWMFKSVAGAAEFTAKYPPQETPIWENFPIFIMEGGLSLGMDFDKSWANHFRRAKYFLFEDENHFFFITQRDKFNRLVEEFLNEIR